MKTEFEKCMAGQCYNCHDESFLAFKNKARKLLTKYNALSYSEKIEKYKVLQEMFACIGTNVSVANPCKVIRKINGTKKNDYQSN